MAAKGRQPPRAGLTRHKDPRVVEVEALCSCGCTMLVPVDHTTPVLTQLREESCLFCGRLGKLALLARPRAALGAFL